MSGGQRSSTPHSTDEGVATRKVALGALARVQDQGAFANIALPAALGRSGLDERDRALVTDLVYGSLRYQRSCEYLVGRFLSEDPPPAAARSLVLGAYQLVHRSDIPSYAAVSATVGATPKRYRGLVNAVLRRVSKAPVEYPDDATELSYPDWILDRLTGDLGADRARDALRSMNEPATTHVRADGYVQDPASQQVAEHLGALLGSAEPDRVDPPLVLDLCAAPGGKATALAAGGATVVAGDSRSSRIGLIVANKQRLSAGGVLPLVMDATHPPLRTATADAVLIDAPCSGLGVLRRRPDARWRVEASAPERLAALQRSMLDAAVPLLRPGGVLLYSVCTLTAVESIEVDQHLAVTWPDLEPLELPGPPWEPHGRGVLLLPQTAETDGMAMFAYRLGGVPSADTEATA